MKRKVLFFCAFAFFSLTLAYTQGCKQKYLGIEAGIDFLTGDLPIKDFIRGDVPSYYNTGEATKNLSILFFKDYFGIKTEIMNLSDKLGLSGGLRFINMNASIGKNRYGTATSDFFYLLYNQSGNNTDYLKIKDITQTSNYLGIPVELRYLFRSTDIGRFYIKTGVEFNYLLQTKTNIGFYNEAMTTFQDDVSKMVGHPGSFYSFFYGAFGLRYGQPSKPAINLELCLPTVVLSKATSGLVIPQSGGGVQVSIQIPIKQKSNNQ